MELFALKHGHSMVPSDVFYSFWKTHFSSWYPHMGQLHNKRLRSRVPQLLAESKDGILLAKKRGTSNRPGAQLRADRDKQCFGKEIGGDFPDREHRASCWRVHVLPQRSGIPRRHYAACRVAQAGTHWRPVSKRKTTLSKRLTVLKIQIGISGIQKEAFHGS